MKRLLEQYKAIILVAVFILGVNTAAGSIIVTAYQNYWVTTCNAYSYDSFFCVFNNAIVADIVGGVLLFLLGYLLFVRWLGIMGARRLALVSLTSTILFILFLYLTFNRIQQVNATDVAYLAPWYDTFFNWSNSMLAALGGALWFLVPGRSETKTRRK